MALTNAQFSMLCSYLAKNAAGWAGDSLMLPEEGDKKIRLETVRRFTDEMRSRLDRMDELATLPERPA